MSEYQCYELVTLDRPLTSKEMAELRRISTRADISPTRFWNEYHWGDLKADPAKLLARYFDAHLYFSDWGSRRFMLRMPARGLDLAALRPYFVGPRARLTKAGTFVVLDCWSESEDADDDGLYEPRLAPLLPVRAQLQHDDFSAAYVAWLSNVQAGDLELDAREPPVPPSLSAPNSAVAALAELLRVDRDLLAAASEGSAAASDDAKDLRLWLESRPVVEKDRWLLRAVEHPDLSVGAELRAAFRRRGRSTGPVACRTAGELLARAQELREARSAAKARARSRTRSRVAPRKKRRKSPAKQQT